VVSEGSVKGSALPQKSQEKPTVITSERRVSGAQRKKRESITRENIRSIAPRPSIAQTSIAKMYLNFIMLLPDACVAKSRLNHSSLQYLMHSVLAKGSNATTMSLRLLSICYGNFIGIASVEQLKCDQSSSVAWAYFEHTTKRLGFDNIGELGNRKVDASNWCILMKKELLSTASRRSTLFLEVLMPWDSVRQAYLFICKAWLINSIDQSKHQKRSVKPYASQASLEREAAVIETVTLDFVVS
jgi:hypothetical protein